MKPEGNQSVLAMEAIRWKGKKGQPQNELEALSKITTGKDQMRKGGAKGGKAFTPSTWQTPEHHVNAFFSMHLTTIHHSIRMFAAIQLCPIAHPKQPARLASSLIAMQNCRRTSYL